MDIEPRVIIYKQIKWKQIENNENHFFPHLGRLLMKLRLQIL